MFKIDAEIKALLPVLTREESDTLEELILDGMHIDDLVVGLLDGDEILVDGHNRKLIADKHGLCYETRTKKFSSREKMIQWVIDNQLGKRNLTDERRAYYRGKEYLNTKKSVGNPQLAQNDTIGKTQGKTAETLADKHGVSRETIKRDAAFAEAVDELPKPEKEAVLSGQSGESKQAIAAGAKPVLCTSCTRCIRVGKALPKNCPDCKALRGPAKKAKPAVLCERCKKLKDPIEGCPGCAIAREKPVAEDERFTDENGTEVPIQLHKVWRAVRILKAAERALTTCAKAFREIEEKTPFREVKLEKGAHYRKFFPTFKAARAMLRAFHPIQVCSVCGGDGCKTCGEKGYNNAQECGK